MAKVTKVMAVPGLPSLSLGDLVSRTFLDQRYEGVVVGLRPGQECNVLVRWHASASIGLFRYTSQHQEITKQ